jgi:hypothetical protein
VEGGVVFTHELEKLDIFLVLPPFLVVVVFSSKVVGRDGEISNWCIKPDVEDFLFISFLRDGTTPLQVSGDASSN